MVWFAFGAHTEESMVTALLRNSSYIDKDLYFKLKTPRWLQSDCAAAFTR